MAETVSYLFIFILLPLSDDDSRKMIFFFSIFFTLLSRGCPGFFRDGTGQGVKIPAAKYQNPVPSHVPSQVLTGCPVPRQKGLFNLAPACIVDGDFCLPNEIDS